MTGMATEPSSGGHHITTPPQKKAVKEDREGRQDGRVAPGGRAEEAADSIRHKPECEVYDPSALYCLCRQPHNNRWVVGDGWGQSQGNCLAAKFLGNTEAACLQTSLSSTDLGDPYYCHHLHSYR